MTLRQLQYIVKVANCGSLTEAAQKLFISQPALTRAIHELEEELRLRVFDRTNKGVVASREGDEFLGYARQLLQQAELIEEKYKGTAHASPRFSVSAQHYSFAVNAFVDVIRQFHADRYEFTLRETETYEIIDDVAQMRSEVGVLYLSEDNETVIRKLLNRNELHFEPIFEVKPHVFLSCTHPLAGEQHLRLEQLEDYPYLSFEQGENNSFYFSEEIINTLDRKKNIKVRDRATLFNLVIGLNGYTVSTGVLSRELNGEQIIAVPLDLPKTITVGCVTRKRVMLSRYAEAYLEAIRRHV